MLGKTKQPLAVAGIGMDERSLNTIDLFFKGPCKNRCILVEDAMAEVSLVDMDALNAKANFEQQRKQYPARPIIAISLSDLDVEDVIFVRKPMSADRLLEALKQVEGQLENTAVSTPSQQQPSIPGNTQTTDSKQEPTSAKVVPLKTKEPASVSRVGSAVAAHQAALQLSEADFKNIIGSASDIDPNDPKQRANAFFNPDEYLLSSVRMAYEEAQRRNVAVQIQSSWCPIMIFPQQEQVNVEIKDSQLRPMAIISGRQANTRISYSSEKKTAQEYELLCKQETLDTKLGIKTDLQDMDAFLWKLALWTSRGKVPTGTDLTTPVFLRYWPCMTRLLLPPHALRIAALWAHQPHSLLQTAEVLKIPQRYVFAFYTAANALDLAGLCRRSSDFLVEPSTTKPKNHNVLTRILKRLKIA